MKRRSIHFLDGHSIKVPSILLLLVPIINISFLMTSTHEGEMGLSGGIRIPGWTLSIGFFLLIAVTSLLFGRSKILFRVSISLICVFVPVVFTIIETRNYILQTVIISICLFSLLYFLNLKESKEELETQFIYAVIPHNIMLLCVVTLSTKYSLLDITWNRVSIFVYLIAFLSFYLYGEKFIRRRWSDKKVIGVLVGSICLFASYIVFDRLNYLFTFLYLLFLLYFPLHVVRFDRFLINLLFDNPYKLLIGSFAAIVLIGSFLLSMPFSSSSGKGIVFIDSLFTATSAVCVTGLVILDTYRDFSFIGQGIILVLIQIGGLGIVTIMTFVGLLLGQTIGIGKEQVVGEIVGSERPKLVYDLIRFVVFITLFIESVGAIILTVGFYLREGNWPLSLWKGVFHGISAFCNAGFALRADSLVMYNQSCLIPLTICLLIIIGGLGFPVISHLFEVVTNRADSRRTPVLVKISIYITFGLLALGYLLFLVGEYNRAFSGLPVFYKHLNALFLSVTARTAGFNSVDMNLLSGSSILVLWILMFIGAGSCSTGGGVKVTTLGVLLATIVSFVKGRPKTILFEKRLPSPLVKRAMILFITSISLIFFVAIALQISQNLPLVETLFETISAFGTVGLSLGTTGELDGFGKFLLILLMFIGRVNILTFISLFVATRESVIGYPEESFMIG